MQKNQSLAYKYALISVFLWSTVATAFKITLVYLSPLELLFYSSLSSLFILGTLIAYQKKLGEVFLHVKQQPFLVLVLGAINPFIYYLVLFKAYDILPAQEAQAINYTWALMFAYLSVVFLKQKLTFADIVAGLICYFGVLIISTRGEPFSLNFSDLYGVLLALFSTLLWSLYWIFNTKSKADATVGLFCNFLVGVVMIGLYIIFTGGIKLPSVEACFGAIYVGFFEMGITFVFWLKAVRLTHNISKISNLIFLSPFLSLVFIHFFIGEEILLSTIIALFLIISGLIIQQKWK
ncbi:DMT family transporter [Sulfurospirillum arcachonense]|uniref:DMT family transporter n=1 Tax=Sulfurospirillum arcachonense TaxID=57666 RepID=UPI000468835F|nr:DMT family transporter [Sulfurospirillum arcachonense]